MHGLDVLDDCRSSGPINDLERTNKVMTYKRVLFPAPAVRSTGYLCKALVGSSKTYAFRESTRMTRSPSILLTHCSRRTMLQFLYVVLSKRSSDSSTDQGETTSVERPFLADHLQKTEYCRSRQQDVGRGTTNVSFCSFRLMLGEKRQCPKVSSCDACFGQDTYPNSVQCHTSMPFHLIE